MMHRDPPGPPMWPTVRRLRRTPLREFPTYLFDVRREYGPVCTFRVPWKRFYLLDDPAAIKDVLVTHQHAFVKSEGTRALGEVLGRGLVTSEEPLHRTMRRIVQPAFHRERIAGYADVMERCARAWQPPPGDFDMHAEMMELTLRIATKTLFGVDRSDEADEVARALYDVIQIFPDALGPFGALLRRLPFGPVRQVRRSRAVLDRIVYAIIAQRRCEGVDRGDALSMLLASRDEESGQGIDDRQIRDEVMTLFIAGHETTANLLSWTWYLLAQHPAIRDRLAGELQRDPQAPYLDHVLSEVMRFYPPVWVLGRDALREVEVGGWRIKRGATVLMCQLVAHKNPDSFAEPERFDPDRWIDAAPLPQFAYFPFGGGARKCIGDQFARLEARIVLSELLRRYRFACTAPGAVQADPIITLRPRGPLMMRPV